jgi:uroporphyrinogen decarboxylase
VLERRLDYPIVFSHEGSPSLTPEDHIEFAQRLAMDAVACDFTWRPNNLFAVASNGREQYVGGAVKSWHDLETLEPPPPLAQQLNHLERYLRAAQGTGVGIIASFSSFFDNALRAVGIAEAMYLFYDNRPLLEKLMDVLADHQQRIMRAVCDRFAGDLAFVLVNDDIAHATGLLIHPDMFLEIFPRRMERLLAPAREHGLLAAFHSEGQIGQVAPALSQIGFDALFLGDYDFAGLVTLREQWRGQLALIAGIPALLLTYGSQAEIEDAVKRHCAQLAPGGGYVLGSAANITEGIPPHSLVALVQAVHRHGRYGS